MKRVNAILATVAICTLFAANTASAEANLALRGIGLKAGVVNPDNVNSTLGAGLIFDLGTLHPHVALQSYAGYWSQTEEAYGVKAGVHDFSFGAKANYMFAVSNPSIQPYAGAGLGLHLLNSHAETAPVYYGGTLLFPGTSIDDSSVKLGLDLGGGLRIDQGGQFAFLADAWFSIVSDVSQFSLMAGVVYMFGR
ncbi:MAG TPA: hypothetical protein VFH88_03935 [Candidatus Krumholzibacteria bacterium]|nr:hypothetical protein [Candidatus Krumholzibacteria bacterium]